MNLKAKTVGRPSTFHVVGSGGSDKTVSCAQYTADGGWKPQAASRDRR